VSKAFTKGDEDLGLVEGVAPRAPLPEDAPNYVTTQGLALLHQELVGLEARRDELASSGEEARRAATRLTSRITELGARIASAVVVTPASLSSRDRVLFGATVRVKVDDGSERSYQIVGVDEADPAQGRIAFVSPLARALAGKEPGDVVSFRSPRGVEQLEITGVVYE